MVKKFYLSRIMGNRIFSEDKKYLGKLEDLVVEVIENKQKVIAAKIKTDKKTSFVNFSDIDIDKVKGQYVIYCKSTQSIEVNKEKTALLAHNILDKQIVDINGRKVVRVNDISCVRTTSGDVFVLAVDVGLEGLFRRLGIAKTVKTLLKPFNKTLQSNLILWDNVQPIINMRSDIKLSTTYARLSTLHPSDLADIIEDMDKKSQASVFEFLDEEKAADVLEELETEAQLNVLKNIPIEKAADVLEKMPADEVADILDDMKEEQAENFLSHMEKEISEEVKELMEYPEYTVGSIMGTDIFYLNKNLTVEETIGELRKINNREEDIYYLYITDEQNKLCGILSLWKLIISEAGKKLCDIMTEDVISVKDMDNINEMIQTISKYNLYSLPVTDENKTLIGNVVLNDVVYELLKTGRRRF